MEDVNKLLEAYNQKSSQKEQDEVIQSFLANDFNSIITKLIQLWTRVETIFVNSTNLVVKFHFREFQTRFFKLIFCVDNIWWNCQLLFEFQ